MGYIKELDGYTLLLSQSLRHYFQTQHRKKLS
jgi:hypothetical protein